MKLIAEVRLRMENYGRVPDVLNAVLQPTMRNVVGANKCLFRHHSQHQKYARMHRVLLVSVQKLHKDLTGVHTGYNSMCSYKDF